MRSAPLVTVLPSALLSKLHGCYRRDEDNGCTTKHGKDYDGILDDGSKKAFSVSVKCSFITHFLDIVWSIKASDESLSDLPIFFAQH